MTPRTVESDPKSVFKWGMKRALSNCILGVRGLSPRKNFLESSSMDCWKTPFSY